MDRLEAVLLSKRLKTFGGRVRRRTTAVLLVSIAVAGCSRHRGTPAGVTRADSAGVQIITSSAEAVSAAATWTIQPHPVLEIPAGEDKGPVLFQIGDVVPLSSERLAVADNGAHAVLVFDSAGGLISRIGREGDGPGEFRQINSLAPLPGDSLAVWDMQQFRISVFDSNGTLVHEATIGDLFRETRASWASVHPLADGDLVFATGTLDWTPHEGASRALSESREIDTDGSGKASYGTFPGTESFASGGSVGMVPFGATTTVTTSGNDFIVGTEVTTELRVFGPDGKLERILRWPDHERPLTAGRFQAYVNSALATVPEAQRSAFRSRLNAMPRPKTQPPYGTVLADSEGRVWVGDYPGQESVVGLARPSRHWLVFGPDGAIAAQVETPGGFDVKSVRGSDIIGVYSDQMGVESIRIYRIASE